MTLAYRSYAHSVSTVQSILRSQGRGRTLRRRGYCIACSPGFYGPDCNKTCGQCTAGNSQCNITTGVCQGGCQAGYITLFCNETCSPGFYGPDCNKTCGQCTAGNSQCNITTGVCQGGCQAGYITLFCNETCTKGYHGDKCNLTCGHCAESGETMKVVCAFLGVRVTTMRCFEGRCMLWAWKKDDSSKRDKSSITNVFVVVIKSFTIFCRKTLQLLCILHVECACSKVYHGDKCNLSCGHCAEGAACHYETGVCPSGCESGYQGPLCDVLKRADCTSMSGLIAGAVVGCVVTFAIGLLVGWLVWRPCALQRKGLKYPSDGAVKYVSDCTGNPTEESSSRLAIRQGSEGSTQTANVYEPLQNGRGNADANCAAYAGLELKSRQRDDAATEVYVNIKCLKKS